MVPSYPDFYNDVFGPIMQPFSSAHTAGPCRMGYLVSCLLGEEVSRIRIQLDPASSWNATFGLQNEDLAFLSGCTGHLPNDAIMFQMRQYCKDHNITYEFVFEPLTESKHHSAGKFTLTGISGKVVEMVSQSLGGGLVATTSIEGYPLEIHGDTYVLLVFDEKRELDHDSLLKSLENSLSLVSDGVSEKEGGGCLHWFKTSDEPAVEGLLPSGVRVEVLRPVTTVITHTYKGPQLFTTMVQWRELAEQQNTSLFEIAVQYEMNSSGWSREQVISYMKDVIRAKMHRATHAIYEENIVLKKTPFSTEDYNLWNTYCKEHKPLCGDTIAHVLHYANAAMIGIPGVEFVPGPMGTGGGLIYSVLCGVKESRGYSDDDLLRGLFIAAGVGAICFTRSEPGGGNVGCMGEMGMCGAMAAAAVTEMIGGTPKQVETAAAMAMMVSVGWPCDPTSGAKGNPCGVRGLMMVSMAPTFADIALSGRDPVFPFHEVLDVADQVGRDMPAKHRACKYAGHSGSPTGRACIAAFLDWHSKLQ